MSSSCSRNFPRLKAYMTKMYERPNAAPRIAIAFASLSINPRLA